MFTSWEKNGSTFFKQSNGFAASFGLYLLLKCRCLASFMVINLLQPIIQHVKDYNSSISSSINSSSSILLIVLINRSDFKIISIECFLPFLKNARV